MSVTASSDRRLDIGAVLQDGLGVIGRNIGPFLLMGVLLDGIPYAVIVASQVLGRTNAAYGFLMAFGYLVILITLPMLQGALTYGAMRDLDGRPATIGDCLKVGAKNALRLLGLLILQTLAFAIGLILLVVPGLFLIVRWSVAGQAVVMEGRGIQEAMERSANLTDNRRWAIFLLLLIYIGVALVVELLIGALSGGITGMPTRPIISAALSPVVNVCSTVLLTSVSTALYRRLRGDKEGGAPEALAEVFA
jgi:hypothetical protein